MAGVKVYGVSVAKEVVKASGTQAFANLKGYDIALTLDDATLDILEQENDKMTAAQMVVDAQEATAKTVNRLTARLKALDKELDNEPEDVVEATRDEFGKEMTKEVDALVAEIEKIPEKRWKKFVANKVKWKSHKIQTGIQVGVGVVGVVGAGLAIASGVPTMGVSLAMGVVGLVRSCAALAKIAADNLSDIVRLQGVIEKELKWLQITYKSKAKQAANSVGMTALNTIFGADLAPSISKVEREVKTWDSRVAGLDVNSHKLAAKVTVAIKDLDKLEKQIKTATTKDAEKIEPKITKLQQKLDELLKKTTEMSKFVLPSEKAIEAAEKVILELRGSTPKVQKVFEKVVPFATSLLLGAADGTIGFKTAEGVSDLVETSAFLAFEISVMAKEAKDLKG